MKEINTTKQDVSKFQKVAIVHYWLVGMRGGEKVLESLLDLFPTATIVTHVYDPKCVSEKIRSHEVRQTFISRLPGAIKHYQKYLPLMPLALELQDMQEFDLIISSESGPAKGIIPRPDALHICYCHTPMRYVWDHYHIYQKSAGWLTKAIMPYLAHKLRIWDVSTAARVDHFVANSSFVASRIEKYYRRSSEVIYPPVNTKEFEISETPSDHYLMTGELVSYKRPDLAIDAFNASGKKLIVIGDGNLRKALQRRARSNITFLGRVPFEELKKHFADCRALIFPGEEDFGIIPVEVMASGRPVVAYGKGGALDTVCPNVSGTFFFEQTVESLNAAIERIENNENLLNCPDIIRTHAQKFDSSLFQSRFKSFLLEAMRTQPSRHE